MTSENSYSIKLLRRLTNGLDDKTPHKKQRMVAKGFFLICATNLFTKFADLLASPKITLTWLMQALGVPAFIISLVVPVRESGSMLPQLLLAGPVSSSSNKLRLYQAGAVVQAMAIAGMALTPMLITGIWAGWIIVLMVVLFSLGRCLCSLVSKAVLGAVIPKSLRGQTTGWSATIAGLASCAVAAFLLTQGASQSVSAVMVLLFVAATCWLLATLFYGMIEMSDSSGVGKSDTAQSFGERLALLQTNRDFRHFVIVRSLLISSALVTPYYILLGGKDSSTIQILGGLLLASGLAKLLSSVVWGQWSDRSSRQAMIASGACVFAIGGITTGIHFIAPALLKTSLLISILYFGLEIAHQGVRVARKTYVVDLATDDTRVDFVSVSNSIIGMLILIAGVILGMLSTVFEPIWLVAGLSLTCLTGALLAVGLREL